MHFLIISFLSSWITWIKIKSFFGKENIVQIITQTWRKRSVMHRVSMVSDYFGETLVTRSLSSSQCWCCI